MAAAQRLSLGVLERLPEAARPLLDPRGLSVGIVHLGVGAFHRAHQAVYTEAACQLTGERRWAICGVSERGPAAAETLAAQDGLYSVLVTGQPAAPSSVRVVASMRETMFALASPAELVSRLADPGVQVVTLTVTEKGYRHNLATRQLPSGDQELQADAAGRPPRTVLGQLVRGLAARRRSGAGPLTVISCDNIPSNGPLLKSLTEQLLAWPSSRFDDGLTEWTAENVSFPATMVDRIVPATTDHWRDEVEQHLGLRDEAPVITEPFSQWVIEDRFAADRPAWELAGAQLVPDVVPYEALKLRALNGAHSALAHLGVLAGCETIPEALSRPGFEALVRQMLDREVAPTLVLPPGTDFASYRESVLDRFANTALPYRCLQVAMDGSQKLPQRLLGTVRDRLAVGEVPQLAVLVVAAWLRAIWAGHDDTGRSVEVSDPLSGPLGQALAAVTEPARVVERALQLEQVFGRDLAEDERFKAALTEALSSLCSNGTASTVAAIAGASTS
jgi:fructuronate reductase